MKHDTIKGLLRCGLCFVVTIAGMFAIMLLYTFEAFIFGWPDMTSLAMGGGIEGIRGATYFLLCSILQNSSLIIFPILLATIGWKYKITDIGLTPLKKDGKDLLMGILVGTVGISIAFVCLIVSGSTRIEGCSFAYMDCILLGFLSYVVVGFGEEIFIRGGLMLSLKVTNNKNLVIVLTSVIFAFMHLGNSGISVLAIINLTFFGVVASYCFMRSGNIWLPIGFHIAWNFFQGSVFGFSVSGNDTKSIITLDIVKETIFTGGKFGPEGGIDVTIALALSFAFVIWYYRNIPEDRFYAD